VGGGGGREREGGEEQKGVVVEFGVLTLITLTLFCWWWWDSTRLSLSQLLEGQSQGAGAAPPKLAHGGVVNSEEFIGLPEAAVRPEDVFFHKYFTEKQKRRSWSILLESCSAPPSLPPTFGMKQVVLEFSTFASWLSWLLSHNQAASLQD
jgi:hypothetical protein